MAKDSFVFYTQWAEQINMLTDNQAGALFKAVCGYVETGKTKKLDAVTNMLFSVIKSQIDRDAAKYEETCQKRKQAGAKGGRPKAEKQKVSTESKKSKRFFEKAKKPDNDNDNDNEYVTHIISPINSPNNSVCNSAHACEDTHTDLVTIGKYENVTVPSAWLSDFRAKYPYADNVIEALSRYKETKSIHNDNDIPYLEAFADADKDKYGSINSKSSSFWHDETKTDAYWDDFYQRALSRRQ